ncbi:hypothetical protein S40288_10931 [Stachybotrys chartarum IBT 40288]|nr:hypothetical protein S40288_10931 [Stachybotrys chartarum IBT 40288]
MARQNTAAGPVNVRVPFFLGDAPPWPGRLRRKIGCDRALPECYNCRRTRRECLGYNIRLQWPDRRDGRRRDGEATVYAPPSNPAELSELYGRYFLNVAYGDFDLAREAGLSAADLVVAAGSPARGLSVHPPILEQGATFLSYYERIISTMVSTLQVKNGFRTELLPMALATAGSSASALCNSIMAVSAFHQGGTQAALPFKTRAIRQLYDSLHADGAAQHQEISEIQMAASMMLCVYSVFDETEGNWHLHLDGAKNMLQRLTANGKLGIQSSFVFTWFLYHEVFGCFTQPFRKLHESFDPLQLLGGLDVDTSLIVGSLGCSIDTLVIIHGINTLRAVSLLATTPSQRAMESWQLHEERSRLETTLQTLRQQLDPQEEEAAAERRTRILATAELYRIAALLYLQRVCPQHGDDGARSIYVQQALRVLSALETATSPWPVFVVACEARDDGQRIQIMQTLDRMNRVRKIGNVGSVKDMVEGFWRQCDLAADSDPERRLKWWEMVESDRPMPWFV